MYTYVEHSIERERERENTQTGRKRQRKNKKLVTRKSGLPHSFRFAPRRGSRFVVQVTYQPCALQWAHRRAAPWRTGSTWIKRTPKRERCASNAAKTWPGPSSLTRSRRSGAPLTQRGGERPGTAMPLGRRARITAERSKPRIMIP